MIELLHRINVPERMSRYNLTSRELEVISEVIDGASYKIVGDRLGIRYNTVHNHLRSIYSKLQVHSMTEAVSKILKTQMHYLSALAGSTLFAPFSLEALPCNLVLSFYLI